MKIRSPFILGFTFFILFSSDLVIGEENNGRRVSWEDLRIISERNIFSRNRVKIEPTRNLEPRNIKKTETREEDYLVLRGITKQANRFVAFIEDSRTGEVKKVIKNGVIGKGKIGNITLDYISYEFEGGSSTVKIGMTMSGETAGMNSAYASGFEMPGQQNFISFPATSQEDKPQVKISDESAKDILQRLKERRKKELGE